LNEERFPFPSPIAAQGETEARSAIDRGEHSPLYDVREPAVQDDNEVTRLLREMRHDLAKLAKISEKASRRSKTHLDFLEGTKFSRRFGLALLIMIVVLMLIQILQMAGYGPGGSDNGNDSTQTLQRIHTAG
jgi:hypothetical protein